MSTVSTTFRSSSTLLSRRQWLGATAVGVTGFSASGWLDVLAARAAEAQPARKKACIVLFLTGGLSQLESFDMKPDAIEEVRGPFKPIDTAVPGIQICEHLPKLAAQMKDIALLRGMSTIGEHGPGCKLMHHAGLFPQATRVKQPNLGSVISAALADPDFGIPTHVVIGRSSIERDFGNSGFIGPKHDGMLIAEPAKGLESLRSPLAAVDFDARMKLFEELEQGFAQNHKLNAVDAHQLSYRNAVNFMRSEKANAFKLEQESDAARDRYGRNQFGEGCLMARRLVEIGVPFVEVKFNTFLHKKNINGALLPWDTHTDMADSALVGLPILDAAMTSLITDLKERGLFDDTLVVCMSEMGRHPGPHSKAGRGHYPQVWTAALAGGGVKGGVVVGKSGPEGREIVDRPISAAELLATICHMVGVSPSLEFNIGDGLRADAERTALQAMRAGIATPVLAKDAAIVKEIL